MTRPDDPTLGIPANDSLSHKLAETCFAKLFADAEALSIQGYLEDGTVVYWNRASELIYGYSAEEAIGGNLFELIIPEELRETVKKAVRWMFDHGRGAPPGRLDLRHMDGSWVPVYSSHTVVSLPGQETMLFCMDADMRALVQAEDELRIAAAAFESQQGMLIADAHGVILRVNRAFTDTLGFTLDDILGQSPEFLLSPRNPPSFFRTVQRQLIRAGTWQGEAWIRRKSGEDDQDWVTLTAVQDGAGQVTHFVGRLTDISQRKDAEARIVQLAFYDPLTDLPNRRLMYDRIHQAMAGTQRTNCHGALLFIDVDDFKTLNDSLGHDVGDLLLKEVARRLKTQVRANDTVARFGGDKFIVMLEDLDPEPGVAGGVVEAVGQKLIQALAFPHHFARGAYQSGASIGAILFREAGTSLDDLIKQAELAMYAAKKAGRGTMRFFDAGMQSAINRRAELIRQLREGLARQEFLLHYQPQLNRQGQLVGAEALLRWQRPGEALRMPGSFIQMAEESGLILSLGQWVLESACTTLVEWGRTPLFQDMMLSVNVSAREFSRNDFVARTTDTLRRSGARPQRLRLELTESMLLDDVDEVVSKMEALRALGISFSLDDFGTGYSSLSYLQRLPLSELKIDQSFVRRMCLEENSAAVVQTIIGLGHSLGLTVIAEGVEDTAHHERLLALACDHFQGYLYGRPMAAGDFLNRAGHLR
ncbi:bifunctional diguanylate cyclase/phosphodiesterase [Zoogloea sp.]|uniref:putative bifunctional diguanylate cyclase/phosphodiesterase n=1 Tax=Zoogloea sp. TaxID=49181 RepID=UPI002626D202|nr:bifunctional diguanylate cyclase/phosphodiesterase [Zoogloea sp.]MDD3352829.1 EAL domain-containing protein [Zoogloea sp.]